MTSSRALAASLVFVAACGARTTLSPSGGSDTGTGGAGAHGGAGPGGSGPGGSGPGGSGPGGSGGGLCTALVAVEPRVPLPALDSFTAPRDPLLLPMRQGRVLSLVRRVPLESPGPVPNAVQFASIEPWSAWPPIIQPPGEALTVSDMVPFVASIEPAGTFAVGVEMFPVNAPPGCTLGEKYGISPDTPPTPDILFVTVSGVCNDSPVAIATAGNGIHLAANDLGISGGPVRTLSTQVLDAAGNTIFAPQDRCATTRMFGDVIPGEQGFLFAHSTAEQDECFINNLPGPASRVVLRRISANGDAGSIVYKGFDDVVFLRLLPRSEGAWLVLQESGASAEVQPAAIAMRLSDGQPGAPFAVTDDGTSRVAAAAMGDGLAVAFVDNADPTAPTIILRVFSAEGALLAATSFSTNEAWLNGDRLALVGSPPGSSVVVGWASMGLPDAGGSVSLRRFDCIGGL